MPFEKYFAGLLSSCSNNIICIKLPLSSIVFLIRDRFLHPWSRKDHPPWYLGFPYCGVWGCSLLSPGTESSLAQLINESGLTEIQREMEEVNKEQEFAVTSCPRARWGIEWDSQAEGSGPTNTTTFPAVRLWKGLSQDMVDVMYTFTWIQWWFDSCYRVHRYRNMIFNWMNIKLWSWNHRATRGTGRL